MKNQKIIIGLVSKIAAGKGAATKYLKKKYNASTYRFSTMLRDVLSRMYLEISRENMQKISTVLRGNFSEDIMARVMAEDVKNDHNSIIVVDGVRRLADIKYLKKLSGFKLISIETKIETRYKRLIVRNENKNDDKKSYEEFLKEEKAETEAQIPEVMLASDIVINNNGTFDSLYEQLDKIINSV